MKSLTVKKHIVLPLILSLTVASSSAFAFGGKHHDKSPEDRLNFISKKLDLTDDQKNEVRLLQEKYMKDVRGKHGKKHVYRDMIHALDVDSPQYDTMLNQISDKASAEAALVAKNRVLFKGHMLKLLTPEQREKLENMPKKRRHGKH